MTTKAQMVADVMAARKTWAMYAAATPNTWARNRALARAQVLDVLLAQWNSLPPHAGSHSGG